MEKKEAKTKAPKQKKSSQEMKINKDMAILEVVQKYPETMGVFFAFGLHCVGCHVAATESLEEGASAHGIVGKDFDSLMTELNKVASSAK